MIWSNVPIPRTISIPLLIGIVAEVLFPIPLLDLSYFFFILAMVLLAIALSSMFWSVREVGKHDISASDALITSGPFSISRNPMYVSWFLVVIAAFCFTGSVWFVLCLAVAWPLTHYTAILPEESVLEERFGDSYVGYCKSVRRYL